MKDGELDTAREQAENLFEWLCCCKASCWDSPMGISMNESVAEWGEAPSVMFGISGLFLCFISFRLTACTVVGVGVLAWELFKEGVSFERSELVPGPTKLVWNYDHLDKLYQGLSNVVSARDRGKFPGKEDNDVLTLCLAGIMQRLGFDFNKIRPSLKSEPVNQGG